MDELVYVYGIALSNKVDSRSLSGLKTIDGCTGLHTYEDGLCAVIYSEVDWDEFNESTLEKKASEMEWVQAKAFTHHEILMQLNDLATVIPMKFCTIFKGWERLKQKTQANIEEWMSLLHYLSGKEEWSVKVYHTTDRLTDYVTASHPDVQNKKAAIENMSKGRQYLERKKLEQFIQDCVKQEQEKYTADRHHEWSKLSEAVVEKKLWNKRVTGKQEEMCWNGAYLIDQSKADAFVRAVGAAQKKGSEAGWIIEATGPWPAYHFSGNEVETVGETR